LFPLICK